MNEIEILKQSVKNMTAAYLEEKELNEKLKQAVRELFLAANVICEVYKEVAMEFIEHDAKALCKILEATLPMRDAQHNSTVKRVIEEGE